MFSNFETLPTLPYWMMIAEYLSSAFNICYTLNLNMYSEQN